MEQPLQPLHRTPERASAHHTRDFLSCQSAVGTCGVLTGSLFTDSLADAPCRAVPRFAVPCHAAAAACPGCALPDPLRPGGWRQDQNQHSRAASDQPIRQICGCHRQAQLLCVGSRRKRDRQQGETAELAAHQTLHRKQHQQQMGLAVTGRQAPHLHLQHTLLAA